MGDFLCLETQDVTFFLFIWHRKPKSTASGWPQKVRSYYVKYSVFQPADLSITWSLQTSRSVYIAKRHH